MDFQTVFVIITFLIAVGYLLKKFFWAPLTETKSTVGKTADGGKTKCGDTNCGCG